MTQQFLNAATGALVEAIDGATLAELKAAKSQAHDNSQDFALPASERRLWGDLRQLITSHINR
jgi:hypothetical protein